MSYPLPGQKEITSLPPLSRESAEWVQERLAREKQRRIQRGFLFWGTICLSLIFFGCFLDKASSTNILCALGEVSPYCIWIVALLGLIPTFLLIALMRGVFAKETKEASPDADDALRIASATSRFIK